MGRGGKLWGPVRTNDCCSNDSQDDVVSLIHLAMIRYTDSLAPRGSALVKIKAVGIAAAGADLTTVSRQERDELR